MKKFLFLSFIMIAAAFCLNAQTRTNRETPFTGTSANAAEWMKKNDRLLRSIAGDVINVIVYSGKKTASGSNDVTLLLYDYANLQIGQIGTVLEMTDNSTENIIFVVWTNESTGDKAIFYNDKDKNQLDVSFSTRLKKYGMGSDTVRFVKTIIKELK
jgi:hypothetical protein